MTDRGIIVASLLFWVITFVISIGVYGGLINEHGMEKKEALKMASLLLLLLLVTMIFYFSFYLYRNITNKENLLGIFSSGNIDTNITVENIDRILKEKLRDRRGLIITSQEDQNNQFEKLEDRIINKIKNIVSPASENEDINSIDQVDDY